MTIAAQGSSLDQSLRMRICRRLGSMLGKVPSKICDVGREGSLTPSVLPDGKPLRACVLTGRSSPDRVPAK